MKKIAIGISPITNEILAGHLDKTGRAWQEKQNVTIETIYAVIYHIENANINNVLITSLADGTPEYKLTLEKLS